VITRSPRHFDRGAPRAETGKMTHERGNPNTGVRDMTPKTPTHRVGWNRKTAVDQRCDRLSRQDNFPPCAVSDKNSLPVVLYPEWQTDYLAAIVELDRKRLAKRVTEAEAVITKRLQTIPQGADYQRELQAIQDALAALRLLKREG